MAIWAAVALVVQLAAFVAVKLTIPNLAHDIVAGRTPQGFFLGAVSLGVGLLNAACMSY
jgi:putative membrane protein